MKKIGIFLAFAPGQSIQCHGIGRLLMHIINNINQDDLQIVIACPKWWEQELHEFLGEKNIHSQYISILTTPEKPNLIKLLFLFQSTIKIIRSSIKKEHRVKVENKNFFLLILKKIIFKINQIRKTLNDKLQIILFSGNSIFLPIQMVIILLGFLFYLSMIFYRNIISLKDKAAFILSKAKNLIFKKTKKIFPNHFLSKIQVFKKGFQDARAYKKYQIIRETYKNLRKYEIKKLVDIINKKNDIELWFVPTIFWGEISKIKKIKILSVPDLAIFEFPTYFTDKIYAEIYPNACEAIESSDYFITYSHHVKTKHIINHFYVPNEKIFVIRHGTERKKNINHYKSLKIIHKHIKEKFTNNWYLYNYDFTDCKFIFYSSQIRSYKNILNLVKAYELLLRKRYVNIKLIITGHLSDSPEIKDYIQKQQLQYDVLSFSNVSSEVLDALNHLAVCSVNPTLFEGGFPFTFAEAYSVGTPSVMSRIPVVMELMEDLPELQDLMLFDPYNVNDMVNKIEWAVNHRDELFEAQKVLYNKFENRTWDVVAKDYLDLFEKVSKNKVLNHES